MLRIGRTCFTTAGRQRMIWDLIRAREADSGFRITPARSRLLPLLSVRGTFRKDVRSSGPMVSSWVHRQDRQDFDQTAIRRGGGLLRRAGVRGILRPHGSIRIYRFKRDRSHSSSILPCPQFLGRPGTGGDSLIIEEFSPLRRSLRRRGHSPKDWL